MIILKYHVKLLILYWIVQITSLSPLRLSAQPELNAAKVDRNVVFGMYSGLALLMDVYYPNDPNGYGIIHISGSSWSRGLSLDAGMLNHKRHVKLEGEVFVEAGYTLFSINHRATPRFNYPAAIEDAQRAVRFIRYHADKYGINPERIGAVGGSSGGHLVCMLGVLDGNEILEDDTPINRMSAKVQCVIARAATTNFLSVDIGESFLGVKVRDKPSTIEYKRAYQASPINHVSADDPPFLLVHGDKDPIVPYVLSEDMYKKLQEMNVPAKLITIEDGVHGPGVINSPEVKKELVLWMNWHLKDR
ncbi:MAG: alpha/beta hydrolase [Eudoraea sp.]|uniref:prolyl oligopeptidase family serine peptidase n=1 Tax=Eudoraea sp. TaxID=1979955 RepID=UPI003C7178B4